MSEPETQEQIDAHNRRTLWEEVARCLTVAREGVEQAQGGLDDLAVYIGSERAEAFADLLDPIVDSLRRAANDAEEAAA